MKLILKYLLKKQRNLWLGATVFFETMEIGAITDFDGVANFVDIPDGTHKVIISYLSYETQEVTLLLPNNSEIIFHLNESGHQLEEVVLQSTRSTRSFKKIPTRIELIGGEELGEKNMMNPTNISMVLRESTGIQMQQTSLSSGNSNIRIQGLDGRYTQLLKDGFPLIWRLFQRIEHYANTSIGSETI